jgi:O-antigen/teichoic acid export membrane protein
MGKEKNSKLFHGLIWSSIEVFIKRALDLIVRLVLARLLFPADFGVVGMA